MVCLTSWGLGAPLDRAVELVPASLKYTGRHQSQLYNNNVSQHYNLGCSFEGCKSHDLYISLLQTSSCWWKWGYKWVFGFLNSNLSLSGVGKARIFFLSWGWRATKFHDWIGLKLDESNLSLPEPITACSRGCFSHNRNRTTLNRFWYLNVLLCSVLVTLMWCNFTEAR